MDTPRSLQFDDVYFSAHDGPGETIYVFLDGNDLPARWQGVDHFTIAETGFGTGLNFLLAWELFDRTAQKGAFLDFISVEKFPLTADFIRSGLSPWAQRLEPYLSNMLAQYPMQVPGFHRIVFDNRVALTLVFGDANAVLPEVEASVDAWFLDGFTPAKNPDMWTEGVFAQMARLSHSATTFSTFTAAGFVKRGLMAAGFAVEKKRGFGPKRDMLAGHFDGPKKPRRKPMKKILIHGAGLAGCSAAYALKLYGFDPVLYDPNGIAAGASGNPVGIINPRFTAYRSAESDFYTAAFAQSVRTFPNLSDCEYRRCGSLHLAMDEEKQKRFTHTKEHWQWEDAHMRYLDPAQASDVAGVAISKPALYLPDSGRINPRSLCQFYARDVAMAREPTGDYDAHIFASGAQMKEIPVHTVRGQITFVESNKISTGIKTNLCYGGYISAPMNGMHVIGSTFQKWLKETDSIAQDDADNINKLTTSIPGLGEFKVTGQRAALRTASQDRFPIVGRMEEGERFVSTAHGSHGIVSSLGGAHLLADYVRGGPLSLGKSTVNALSLSRFFEREQRKAGKKN